MAQQSFPFTLANLAGGNQPVSDIDANFAICLRGDATTTMGYIPYWGSTNGTYPAPGYNTTPAFGTITKVVGVDTNNKLPAVDASNLTNVPAGVVLNYISGLTLSNDGTTPNSVLDIAAGTAADSTNASMITLASAFTKSTAGTWTAGTGNNGMGTGLTIANSTWYHVFAIINASAADVYFDTSVSAANKPVGTTYFRRIGSFKTDGSAHIITFQQVGNIFRWLTPVLDGSNVTLSTTYANLTISAPLGVSTEAYGNVQETTNHAVQVRPTFGTDGAAAGGASPLGKVGNQSTGLSAWRCLTNTSSQIQWGSEAAAAGSYLTTEGWVDFRGMT